MKEFRYSVKSPELEEFEENQEIRERFRSAPYGGNYGTAAVTDFRPRAVVKPKKTAEENRPFIARGLDSLSGVNGLNRGGQGKAAALEYGEGRPGAPYEVRGRNGQDDRGRAEGLPGYGGL